MASRGVELSDAQAAAFAADLLELASLGCLAPGLDSAPNVGPGSAPRSGAGPDGVGGSRDPGASNTGVSNFIEGHFSE